MPASIADIAFERGPRIIQRLVLIAALAALVLSVVLVAVRTQYDGRVFPAVYVAGMDLGGLTNEEARAVLQRRVDDLDQQTVRFTHGDRSWTPTLRELGADFDVNGTLERAYDVGRDDGAAGRLGDMVGLARGNRSIPFAMTFDHAALSAWLDAVDRDLGAPPHDAYLQIQTGTVSIVPEVDGTIVDRMAATRIVLDALQRMTPVETSLPVVPQIADVRAVDIEPVRARLATALASPVRLSFGQASWTLTGAELGTFVVQRVDPAKTGSEAFSVSLDTAKLSNWLHQRIAPAITRDPVDAVVGWDGGLVSVVPSVDGVRLQPETLARQVEISFFGDHAPIVVPVDLIKATVDSNNLAALGITTLLGSGDSNYEGSNDGRRTNVELGAYYLNNTLVPPGAEFSFNDAIGVISKERGFVEAQVILGERIGQDIGGGICQVSTTAFRAAYLAGLPMNEWHPHLYRIPFYELDGWAPGLDAAIFQPSEDPATWDDFTFTNPTDSWMLVQSGTTGTNVVVNIYGPAVGYRVETKGPEYGETIPKEPDQEIVDSKMPPGTWKQTESAQDGVEVIHRRSVYSAAGELLREDQWYSRYQARGNVYQVSLDMVCKSPAGSCFGREE